MNQARKDCGHQGVTAKEQLNRRKRAGRYIWSQLEQRVKDEERTIVMVRSPEQTMRKHTEKIKALRQARLNGRNAKS